VPFHAVRTRFLGNIASSVMSALPLDTLKGLWGGELPSAAAGFGGSSDSPLEQRGFELPVPLNLSGQTEVPQRRKGQSRKRRPSCGGTKGSNPSSSTDESVFSGAFAYGELSTDAFNAVEQLGTEHTMVARHIQGYRRQRV